MLDADVLRAGQVGNGARDLQYLVIRASRQTQLLHRLAEQTVGVGGQTAELLDVPVGHLRVGVDARLLQPFALRRSRLGHALANGRRRLGLALGGQLAMWHARDVDVYVDPVQQRPGYARQIVLNLPRRAAALALRIGEVAARTSPRSENKLVARDRIKTSRVIIAYTILRYKRRANPFVFRATRRRGSWLKQNQSDREIWNL